MYEDCFTSAVRQGYLASDGQGGYRATDSGMTVATRPFHAANEGIAPLHPIPQVTMERMVNLLARISDAAFGMPEPPSHFILTHKKKLYLRMGMVASLEGFVAHCLELEGHRDDVYITTWQAYKVEGHTWDVLDLLSRGDALTFDDLHKKLSRRNVTAQVHAKDVKELVKRGWAEERSGVVQITSKGKQVRAEVEAETERLFFLPWSCLSESELDELSNLATQLCDELNKLEGRKEVL